MELPTQRETAAVRSFTAVEARGLGSGPGQGCAPSEGPGDLSLPFPASGDAWKPVSSPGLQPHRPPLSPPGLFLGVSVFLYRHQLL